MRPSRPLLVVAVALLGIPGCGGGGSGGGGGGGGNGGPTGPGGNDFSPTSNTTLSGNHSYGTVTIPAGVTVTVTGDLVIAASGDVVIAGALAGDCVAIAITGGGSLTVTGAIRNDCAALPDGDPPTIDLVADGAVVFDGAEVSSSGDVTVKNDPTLGDADFPAAIAPAAAGAPPAASRGRGLALAQSVRVFEIKSASRFTHPGGAMPGADGTDTAGGDRGRRGARFTFYSRGDLTVDASTIDGQDGGAGGDHDRSAAGNVTATGGDGGDGGDVKILATRQVILQNGTTVKSGDGGPGGEATATSTGGGAARAGSATATGGDGGQAGLLRASGGAGIVIQSGATVEIGKGGDGGDGTATGADGAVCVDGHGQHGGDATATGGDGADSPEGRLRLTGNVSGAPNLAGGDGGDGGDASATAGKGKDGENCDDCKDGGDGGTGSATGGDGGDSLIRDLSGAVFGDGGDGGSGSISAGDGGDGFSCCDPPDKGGDGGDGGDAAGKDGTPGTGRNDGTARGVTISGHGNAGDGGDGVPVGSAGGPGTDGTTSQGPKNVTGSFGTGQGGDPCSEPQTFRVDPRSVSQSGGVVPTGTQTLTLVDEAAQAVGQMVVAFANAVFVGLDPDRFGIGGGGSIELRLDQATVDGQPLPVDGQREQVEVCGVNNGSTVMLMVERTTSAGSLLNAQSFQFLNGCLRFLGADRLKLSLDPNSRVATDMIIGILEGP